MHVHRLVGWLARREQLGAIGTRSACTARNLGFRSPRAVVFVIRPDRPTGAHRRRFLADRAVEPVHRRRPLSMAERRGIARRTGRRSPGLHGDSGAAHRLHRRVELEWVGVAWNWRPRRHCLRDVCARTPHVQLAQPDVGQQRAAAGPASPTDAVHPGRNHAASRCGTTHAGDTAARGDDRAERPRPLLTPTSSCRCARSGAMWAISWTASARAAFPMPS